MSSLATQFQRRYQNLKLINGIFVPTFNENDGIYARVMAWFFSNKFWLSSLAVFEKFLFFLIFFAVQAVLHKSERNASDKPRDAFTFHVTETYNTQWSKLNWLQNQASPGSFSMLYDDSKLHKETKWCEKLGSTVQSPRTVRLIQNFQNLWSNYDKIDF